MLDLYQTFRISSWSSSDMIYYVEDVPILHVSSQEPSTSSKSQTKSVSQIMTDLHQTFRISSWSSTNIIYDIKDDLFIQVYSQEPSPSSKPPCNQKLTLSQSLAELSLSYLMIDWLSGWLNDLTNNWYYMRSCRPLVLFFCKSKYFMLYYHT